MRKKQDFFKKRFITKKDNLLFFNQYTLLIDIQRANENASEHQSNDDILPIGHVQKI